MTTQTQATDSVLTDEQLGEINGGVSKMYYTFNQYGDVILHYVDAYRHHYYTINRYGDTILHL